MPEICLLRTAASRWPDHLALMPSPGEPLTFRALDRAVDVVAGAWQQAGLQPADPLALLGPRDAASVIAILAALRAGAVVCPLNTRNPPAMLARQLEALNARWLVADEPCCLPPTRSPAARWLPRMPAVPSRGAILAPQPVARPAAAPATLLFTSGSTGAPRIVVHHYANHVASARACIRVNGLGVEDRWLLALPLYHVGGLAVIFRCLAAGATMVVAPAEVPLDAVVMAQAVTHLSLVPTQVQRVLADAAATRRLRNARVILLGGAPLAAPLVRAAVGAGLAVCPTYGLTEMASQVATVPATATGEARLLPPAPLPGVEVAIATDGELRVRGAMRFLGYWNGSIYIEPPRKDGWYATGDLGTCDARGGLTIAGRRDNLFISGGENIQPEEIEAALLALPGVVDALVVPVADAEFGERPAAFVRVGGGALDVDSLRNALAERLPRYKIPIWLRTWPQALGDGGLKTSRVCARQLARETGVAT